MYAPRGLSRSELGKFDLIVADDRLHLFAVTLPAHDVVVHAVSDDGLSWRELPDALHTGDPGAPDDDEIYSLNVAAGPDGYVMLYTGLARAEDGLVQRTCRATSPDLTRWTKDPANPVAEADGRWYDVGPKPTGRVSWRDPKPVRVGGEWLAPLCAHENDGPLLRRGCVGLLASPDLVRWETRPPLFAPRAAWDMETPQLFQVDGRWYLTAAISEDRGQRYWTAPGPTGPFARPADGGLLGTPEHYAARVVEWRGRTLHLAQLSLDYEEPGVGRRSGKYASPPLELIARADGSLACRGFAGWEAYTGERAPLTPAAATLFHGVASDGWWLECRTGRDALASAAAIGDGIVSGTLRLDAPLGGMALRLDERGGGLFARLAAGGREVVLERWGAGPARAADRPFKYAEVARGVLARPLGAAAEVRLLAAGHYLELSVDGEVALVAATPETGLGRAGLWVDSGLAAADLSFAPLVGGFGL